MPRIIPIRDLKNTAAISQMCNESTEPIYVTKNGYGDMVVLSMEAFEKLYFESEIYFKLQEAEREAELTDKCFSSKEKPNGSIKCKREPVAIQVRMIFPVF